MKIEYTTRGSLSDWVNKKMSETGINQTALIRSSQLPKTTISRICRNSNDKGSSYQATLPVVWALSIGLKLTRAEATEMLFSAFPEMELWGKFLDERLSIYDVNYILDETGLTLWGNPEE